MGFYLYWRLYLPILRLNEVFQFLFFSFIMVWYIKLCFLYILLVYNVNCMKSSNVYVCCQPNENVNCANKNRVPMIFTWAQIFCWISFDKCLVCHFFCFFVCLVFCRSASIIKIIYLLLSNHYITLNHKFTYSIAFKLNDLVQTFWVFLSSLLECWSIYFWQNRIYSYVPCQFWP